MIKNYEVSAALISFGIGIVLKLSESQAESRSTSLARKKDDFFEVIHPVQFKRGEKIGADPAQLTKSLLERLKEVEIPDKNLEDKGEAKNILKAKKS